MRAPIAAGANPVVFCRYLATAAHVADGLRRAYPDLRSDAVTGALAQEERKLRVEALGEADEGAEDGAPRAPRLLVATDCLSEGVNLQALFDMVVHYDLSWNPTRHQQREGRVDRFGQPSPLVRSLLMFSPDSAIDGAVLEVILRKAAVIRSSTGVALSLPDERGAVSGALMRRVLLRRGARQQQLSLDLGLDADAARMDVLWTDLAESERRSRTRFAQNAMRPAEVAPKWQRWRDAFGGPDEVRRFVADAAHASGAALGARRDGSAEPDASGLPDGLRERLEGRGLSGRLRVAFGPAIPGALAVGRQHPLVSILADGVLEGAGPRGARAGLRRAHRRLDQPRRHTPDHRRAAAAALQADRVAVVGPRRASAAGRGGAGGGAGRRRAGRDRRGRAAAARCARQPRPGPGRPRAAAGPARPAPGGGAVRPARGVRGRSGRRRWPRTTSGCAAPTSAAPWGLRTGCGWRRCRRPT